MEIETKLYLIKIFSVFMIALGISGVIFTFIIIFDIGSILGGKK